MASSDDEGEAMPHTVSNYHFVDDKEEPIPFSELPVQWNDDKGLDWEGKQIFLHGTTDNGLLKIYKQVTAWKFDLSDVNPEISVLSKANNWIKLQKPRKCFEDTIRTILITVHCLHFVRKNPETPGISVWDNLSEVFSSYEARPSENDLVDHTTFISEAVKKDETLANSKFLVTFLEEKPGKKKTLDEDSGTITRTGFIVHDNMMDEKEEDDESDEEVDLFDPVCSICDNGGDLLCCEGRCMRSFHATVEAGSHSNCVSLRFSDVQVEAMQNFFCKNCQYKQHQCFSCGELGSSDKLSGAEVFPCVSATCGRFYHPHCVAKLLHRESAADTEKLQKKIVAGEAFTCPIHKCIACEQGEDRMDPDLQFASCRRCPESYHRKCLPREIAFEDHEDEGIEKRAWDDFVPNRILIYCLKHVIDKKLETPIRNHIKFPDDGQKNEKQASHQLTVEEDTRKRERSLASEDAPRERTLGKARKGFDLSSTIEEGDSPKKRVRRSDEPDVSNKQKVADTSTKPLNNTASTKFSKSTTKDDRPSLGERSCALINRGPESVNSRNEDMRDDEHERSLLVDDDAKRRILALMKDATSSITLKEVIKKHKGVTHRVSSKHVVDKTITLGRVEGSVKALRTALKMLEEGCKMQNAKEVCEPGLLRQMVRWKNKLQVYLAPFFHGVRYTSFGRHFTKVDKLKEIVDRLHCYVQEGDTIVDFCCGANDFSLLVKKKLDKTGKKCSYKNFDLLQTKNDFNFEKRDWMSVQPKELPTGSQLIMGLNPPFALANEFIDKALEFKPKLLILVVPRETERLDKKHTPYDLVWEDDELLAGKSFYLPGSVDVNDNELDDWNRNPPPLYIWSRSDWTAKHKAIAQKHGHITSVQEQPHMEDDHDEPLEQPHLEDDHDKPLDDKPLGRPHLEDDHDKPLGRPHLDDGHDEPLVPDYPKEDHVLNAQTLVPPHDDYTVRSKVHEQIQERRASVSESQKESVPINNGDRKVCGNYRHEKSHSNRYPKKWQRNRGKSWRGLGEASEKGRRDGQSSLRPLEAYSREQVSKEHDRHFGHGVTESHSHFRTGSGPSYADNSAMRNGQSSLRTPEASSRRQVSEERDRHFAHGVAESHSHFQTGSGPPYAADIARRCGINHEEPYYSVNPGRSMGAGPGPDYGVMNSEGQYGFYQRENTDSRAYGSYVGQIGDYARESAIRSDFRPSGPQDPYTSSQGNTFLGGQVPGFPSPYSHLGSAPDSSYSSMNASVMQRYAPQLNDQNYASMNNLGYELPRAGRNGIPDPRVPPSGYQVDTCPYRPF